jgi:hypothetical protein
MGDNLYTAYWQSLLPSIIQQFEVGKTTLQMNVEGLRKFGDRQSYYSNFKIINGKLEIPKNAYAQGRDLYAVLIQDDFFKDNLANSTIHIIITNDLNLKMEILADNAPDFFTEEDFEELSRFPKQLYNESPEHKETYQKLKLTYSKIEYWAQQSQKKAYPKGATQVRKRPTNQANKFEEYQWAKIFPDTESRNGGILAFTAGINTEDYFNIKIDTVGIGDGDERRQKYYKHRGDFYNSALVKLISKNQILDKGWDYLINLTVNIITDLKPHFDLIFSQIINTAGKEKEKKEDNAPFKSWPLNSILYGPPGTGKTYKMQQLIEEMGLIEKLPASQPDYKTFVSGYHWWELLAMFLLDHSNATVPQMLDHELIKAKLSISNIQHAPQRLWSTLQHHTVENCPNVKLQSRHGEPIFYKDAGSSWRLDNAIEFRQQFPYLVEEWEAFKSTSISSSIKKNFLFTTCHQSLSYEDFVEGIKPVLSESEQNPDADTGIRYEIRKGLFYQACEHASQLAGYLNLKDALRDSKENRQINFKKAVKQNRIYALFLDEINRANISAVFGELITLIEDDKRLGSTNEIADTVLPYSQTTFGVPANLFIVGTMNTADRSVEALDTALRRRFVFEPMLPNADLLSPNFQLQRLWIKHWMAEPGTKEWNDWEKAEAAFIQLTGMRKDEQKYIELAETKEKTDNEQLWMSQNPNEVFQGIVSYVDGIDCNNLLNMINRRLETLLSKDHTIGHAWLMDVYSLIDLQNAFKNKILPLLQEYFYNNYEKIALVLGEEWIERMDAKGIFPKNILAGNELKSDYEEKQLLKLKDPSSANEKMFQSIYA